MQAVLLIDIGSTYTKVTAVDVDSERILGTAMAFTTADSDVNTGFQNALDHLRQTTGKLEFTERFACSSAAGGLKMIAVGLVPDLTAEAAKRAALSAGAKVLNTYSFELTSSDCAEIRRLQPEIILLSGGTDGGNKEVILHNASALSGIDVDFTVVIAGNKSVAGDVADILTAVGKHARVCENVMPDFNVLNIEPAREIIREVFLQRIIRAKGITHVQELIDGILMPTPLAVMNAAKLLSAGSGNEPGLGDIMVVDVGGATTDVYSIADGKPTRTGVVVKGLPEPFAKRTVEGDLGVRISIHALLEAAGYETVRDKTGLSETDFRKCLDQVEKSLETLPQAGDSIAALDFGLASVAVRMATERHAGRIETAYAPFGVFHTQTGKDLTGIRYVIGTGGPVIFGQNPGRILESAMASGETSPVLVPRHAEFLLDEKYIMAAMGLLGECYPEKAVRIMKKGLAKL